MRPLTRPGVPAARAVYVEKLEQVQGALGSEYLVQYWKVLATQRRSTTYHYEIAAVTYNLGTRRPGNSFIARDYKFTHYNL